MTVEELIDYLRRNYSPSDVVAFSLWGVDDVHSLARELGLGDVSQEDARGILLSFQHCADCSIGLNWHGLEAEIRQALPRGGAA